jgi:hypothetical protein
LNQPQGKHVTEAIDWNKEFPITSVTRADLVSAGFSQEQVSQLTDEDMQQIASAMEDIYCDHGYWEDLELCTKRTLEHKEEDAVLAQKQQTNEEEDQS